MAPALTEDLRSPALMRRLHEICLVPDEEPLADLGDPRADTLLKQAEILLTAWGCPRIDRTTLERLPALRAIVHAAGTVKGHVDEECYRSGIRVSSAAAANALPVAEFTLAAILFANKKVFRLHHRYRELRGFRLWSREFPDASNYGKVIGVVGASRIGRRVIELLRPFDFAVLCADPFLDSAEAVRLGVERVELDDLLRRSDVVSLHAPALPETRHLLDRRRLALLRDGSVLINTARGALVDTEALTEELASGRIDAVIDTTDPEVLPTGSPLYDLPNVFLTPHVAGSMGSEVVRMGMLALEEIERYARGEPFLHEVRLEDLGRLA
jgi:phosphoglycerate dehydrogenase-like enzyme